MLIRILFLSLVVLISDTALGQDLSRPSSGPTNPLQGTADEQAACRNDSVTLCRDAIPDTFRVLACLQQNRQRISKPCRQVLESHGQ